MKPTPGKTQGALPPPFIERRHDPFTRSVVDSKLTPEAARNLPQGPARAAAIAAVVQQALSAIWYPADNEQPIASSKLPVVEPPVAPRSQGELH